MDRTSTTTTGYDIWNEEIPENKNNQTLTNGGRHFKTQLSYPTPTNEGRHFKPPHLETDNPVEALSKSTQQTPTKEDEVLMQLQKTQANISLWGLLMASYKHRQNLVDLLNQIQVPTTTTFQDLNAMIGSINRELTISYSNKDLLLCLMPCFMLRSTSLHAYMFRSTCFRLYAMFSYVLCLFCSRLMLGLCAHMLV